MTDDFAAATPRPWSQQEPGSCSIVCTRGRHIAFAENDVDALAAKLRGNGAVDLALYPSPREARDNATLIVAAVNERDALIARIDALIIETAMLRAERDRLASELPGLRQQCEERQRRHHELLAEVEAWRPIIREIMRAKP